MVCNVCLKVRVDMRRIFRLKLREKKGQWGVSQQVKRGIETKKQSGEQQN